MTEKRSKYDTDPLDPDFVRRTEELMGRTGGASPAEKTAPLRPGPAPVDEPTRRFDEQAADSYPSVFVPPAYQPPRPQQQQPFTTFGAGEGGPLAPNAAAPPGPSSPYQPYARPSSRTVTRLGISENIANVLPYLPFYIGLVAALIELAAVPRNETRTRFHAAQGLALHIAVLAGTLLFQLVAAITGSGFGGTIFRLAAFVFLVVSAIRVWQGKPHHIAPLDEPTRLLNERIPPMSR